MDLFLAGKHVLVTGASAGIGLACARLFAEEGCTLTMVARNVEKLEAAAAEIRERGGEVRTLAADLSLSEEVTRVAAGAGPVDVLVNNAGAIPPGDFLSVDDGAWRRAWDLKVFGYVGLTRALFPVLRARQGVVVQVIGSSGERAEPNYIAGSMGNAALMAFTRGAGAASLSEGVRIVGVNPGAVATERIEMLLRARAKSEFGDETRWADALKHLSGRRASTPEEIANAVVFLASSRSANTSGTILTIDDPARGPL